MAMDDVTGSLDVLKAQFNNLFRDETNLHNWLQQQKIYALQKLCFKIGNVIHSLEKELLATKKDPLNKVSENDFVADNNDSDSAADESADNKNPSSSYEEYIGFFTQIQNRIHFHIKMRPEYNVDNTAYHYAHYMKNKATHLGRTIQRGCQDYLFSREFLEHNEELIPIFSQLHRDINALTDMIDFPNTVAGQDSYAHIIDIASDNDRTDDLDDWLMVHRQASNDRLRRRHVHPVEDYSDDFADDDIDERLERPLVQLDSSSSESDFEDTPVVSNEAQPEMYRTIDDESAQTNEEIFSEPPSFMNDEQVAVSDSESESGSETPCEEQPEIKSVYAGDNLFAPGRNKRSSFSFDFTNSADDSREFRF